MRWEPTEEPPVGEDPVAEPPTLEVEVSEPNEVGRILGPNGEVVRVVYDRTIVPFGFH